MRFLAVAAVITALAAVACGGDDDDGDFLAEADAICTEQTQTVGELITSEGNPTTFEAAAELTAAREPLSAEALSRLQELEPPDELADGYGEYLSLLEERLDVLRQQVEAGEQGNEQRFGELDQGLLELDRELDEVGAEIGFEACANVLPADEVDAVTTLLEDVATTGDPAQCTEDYTENFVENNLGGLEACERFEGDQDAQAESIELANVAGVSETVAFADVTYEGGEFDGQTPQLTLVYEDGRWKLDSVFIPPEP